MNYSARLKRLRLLLKSLPCDALIIENPIDLFYLTGFVFSAGKLLVSEDDAALIVDGRYFEKSSQQTLFPTLLLNDAVVNDWMIDSRIKTLGFDQVHTSYDRYLSLMEMTSKIKETSHSIELAPIDSPIFKLRMIKDEEEIQALRSAAHLGYQGYEYVVSLLEEGVSEKDLALKLEFFWKSLGGSHLAFDPIIAFGSNGSMPHYRVGKRCLTSDTSVLIDIGVVLSHYHSDMTRVHFFGTPPLEITKIYSIVEEAKERALSRCRPGVLIQELDHTARDWIAAKGYGEYFTHSLGHGIGLEVHEPPILRQKGSYAEVSLEAGMVITIEPGIYLPGIGGVRLEDTILITNSGFENLTKAAG